MQRRQKQIQPTDLKTRAIGAIVRELRERAGHSQETSQRRVRLRPNLYQPGGERDHQPDGGPAVEDCRRAGDPTESVREAHGRLGSGSPAIVDAALGLEAALRTS